LRRGAPSLRAQSCRSEGAYIREARIVDAWELSDALEVNLIRHRGLSNRETIHG
jgi:hypothetical protein